MFSVSCADISVPSGIESINAILFENLKDFEERITMLEQGMIEEYILEVLGINDEMLNLEKSCWYIIIQEGGICFTDLLKVKGV